MRRNEWLLWGAVLLFGCAEEGASTDAATSTRARELLGVEAPAVARPAPVALPADVKAAAHVDPAAALAAPGAAPAEVAPAVPGVAAPNGPPALDPLAALPGAPGTVAPTKLPDIATNETPTAVETVDGVAPDVRLYGKTWGTEPAHPGELYAATPPVGAVDVRDRGEWLGNAPTDLELDAEGEPGNDDLRPMGTAEQLSMDFPWGKGEDGNWQGTGVLDPEPLRSAPNAEVLAAATDMSSDHEKKTMRLTALVSLGRRKLPVSLSVLDKALGDPDLMVRQLALSGLIEHGGPGALPLMWRAQRDPHPHVRGMAIWAIALYGTEEAAKAIDAGIADPDPSVQGMAVLATTALRDMGKIWSVLEVAAASGDQRLYQEAAYVLSNLEARRALELLAKTLRESTDRLKRQTFAHYLKMARRNHPHLLVAGSSTR